MENTIKNIKKVNVIVENVFSKLFGSNNNQNSNPSFDSQGIKKTGIASYDFNGNAIDKLTLDSQTMISELFNFDFKNSKLSFLLTSKYHAVSLQLDLKKEKVVYFEGDWYDGQFIGGKFVPVTEFSGDLFYGNFIGMNKEYKSEPLSFKDGTFNDTSKKGILGLSDTKNLIGIKEFNLITVPENHYIRIISNKNIESYIKVVKRLNKDNSVFLYEVYDGAMNSTKQIQLHWQEIKTAYNSYSSIKTKNIKEIPGLINVEEGIRSIGITSEPVRYVPEKYDNKPRSFDLSLISFLGLKGVIKLYFPIESHYNKYLSILNSIKTGTFLSDLITIKRGISIGDINSAGDFSYLKNIFIEKSRYTDNLTSEQSEAMKRLNDFFAYFVDNIVKSKNLHEPNKRAADLIIKKIKDFLISNKTTEKPQVSKASATVKPGSNIKNMKI